MLSFNERIYQPPATHFAHKKEKKVAIVKLKSSEDLIDIRKKIEDCDLVFINIAGARRDELSHNVGKIKAAARQKDKKVFGLDPRWIIVSAFDSK